MKNKILFLLLSIFVAIPLFSFEQSSIDQATFKVGKSFFDRQLYSEAEGRFLDIVRKYPDSPLYHQSLFYLGNTYAHKGEYKSALQYYKLLLTKSKTISEKQKAILGIAKSWLQLGVHDKAGDFYSFFVSEYPESEYSPAALYFAGIARERDNNIPAAIEKYRAILSDYENSEYYSRAIEKIAVLDSTTPESLWSSTKNVETQEEKSNLSDEIWEFEDTDLKAQSTANISKILASPSVITQMTHTAPTVITQVIQAPIVVVTQQVVAPVVITQIIESPQNTSESSSSIKQDTNKNALVEATVVRQKDGVFEPVLSAEQQKQQEMLESYKKIWEEEYQLKIKQQELAQTQQSIKDLVQLSEDKAQVLKIKEQSLQEQKDRIQNNTYIDLNNMNIEKHTQFTTPPIFTQIPIADEPTSAPASPVPPIANEANYDDYYDDDYGDYGDEGMDYGDDYGNYGDYDEYGYGDDYGY